MQSTKPQLKAFITGTTGFLGTHLCHQLLDENWQVYALVRDIKKAKFLLNDKVQIIQGDILNPTDFANQLPQDIDAIFHTAASTNTWHINNKSQWQTNIQGTKNLIEIGEKLNIHRFIHVSSVVVYGIHKTLSNIHEELEKIGINSSINYVKTKSLSEQLVLKSGHINPIIINPTHIIGPGDTNNWARLFKMVAEQKLPSIPNGSGSFVDVRDVAGSIINAYKYGRVGENYLLGGNNISFKTFVEQLAEILKVKPTKIQLPNWLLMLIAHIKNFISKITKKEPDITPESVTLISDVYACDSKKAKQELKHNNRDFNDSLKDTIDFLRKQKLI